MIYRIYKAENERKGFGQNQYDYHFNFDCDAIFDSNWSRTISHHVLRSYQYQCRNLDMLLVSTLLCLFLRSLYHIYSSFQLKIVLAYQLCSNKHCICEIRQEMRIRKTRQYMDIKIWFLYMIMSETLELWVKQSMCLIKTLIGISVWITATLA